MRTQSKTQNYKVSYIKNVGGKGEMIVKGADEANALNNAYNTCFTGRDFKVIGETECAVTNKGNTRGRNRLN